MLSTEHVIKMNGFTLFRDHADKRKYYYLPKGDVRIANNGKKLSYYVALDSAMRESSDQDSQKIGYLTLEVELGPTEEELENLKKDFPKLLPYAQKQALEEKKERGESIDPKELDEIDAISSTDEFVLAPVMFKEGQVKIFVLGVDGSEEQPINGVEIVGSTQPSLFGRQTAVFSSTLKGVNAEIMYNLLSDQNEKRDQEEKPDDENEKKEPHIHSQISIIYDLTYKGIKPAYYVKITVDFEAIENYWRHNFELDGKFNWGKNLDGTSKVAIAADVDVDIMFRDLINQGSIVIQQIDFTGKNTDSPLGSEDPSAIKLVKRLLSAELFDPAPLPKDDYSAFTEAAKALGNAVGDDTGKEGEKKPDGQTSPSNNTKESKFPSFSSIAGEDKKISKDDWLKNDLSEADFNKYAQTVEYVSPKKYKEFYDAQRKNDKEYTIVFSEAAGKDNIISKEDWKRIEAPDEQWSQYASKETCINEEQYNKFKTEQTNSDDSPKSPIETIADGVASAVSALEWNLDVRMAYSYKKRDTSEVKKRTYIFNKQQATDFYIHPQGMLTVEGTEFDAEKQVAIGNLGQEMFRNHIIQFRSALDFDTYHLKYIGIDVRHPDSTGTHLELTKEKPSADIKFYSENFGITGKPGEKLSYKVSMVFDSLNQVGFDNNESIVIEKEYETSDKVIVIGEDHIEKIHPLSIQTGNLTLDQNIKSATLSILEEDKETKTLGPSVYNQKLTASTSKIVLLNSEKNYRAQIQYDLENLFNNVKVTTRDLDVTTEVLKAKELIIEDPTVGMVLFRTADGDETFSTDTNVRMVSVVLKQGDKEPLTLSLTKSDPMYYFVAKYNAEAPEKITIESATAYRRDGTVENIILNEKEFDPNLTEYVLNI